MMVEALREISVPVPTPASAKPLFPVSLSDTAAEQQPQKQEPLSAISSLAFVAEAGSDATPAQPESRSVSRASTYASEDFSASSSRQEGSEAGIETEEDEGMVLVGRPGR